jgi:predicted transcriptional regulator
MRLPVELVKRIDRMAKLRDVARSVVVQEFISEAIDQQELTVKAMTDPLVSQALMQAFARPEVLRALGSVMREDLTDDQLSLFAAVTTGAAAAARSVDASRKTKEAPLVSEQGHRNTKPAVSRTSRVSAQGRDSKPAGQSTPTPARKRNRQPLGSEDGA